MGAPKKEQLTGGKFPMTLTASRAILGYLTRLSNEQ
ncbi:hypothetical protein K239x_18360 [Planctomycetes bacterium K23_9]|uniref:Uncharacterized protein n=1 Tax=Stieleria marina TaxID=1930275 RepID=A0A517NRY7_9BACT|nr:hypothetical protein K239x_18360 [Planctomycetes bacterium K23_9]